MAELTHWYQEAWGATKCGLPLKSGVRLVSRRQSATCPSCRG